MSNHQGVPNLHLEQELELEVNALIAEQNRHHCPQQVESEDWMWSVTQADLGDDPKCSICFEHFQVDDIERII